MPNTLSYSYSKVVVSDYSQHFLFVSLNSDFYNLGSFSGIYCPNIQLQALVELLEEENVQIPSWICFTSVDGENAPSGESFKDCLEAINKSDKVGAVGINCAPPHFMENLICKFKQVTLKSHPNSLNILKRNSMFMIRE